MNSEELAFREAIIDNPDDDMQRLIFADWLEERGDPRAEFIRVQCELARAPDRAERWDLRQRERELLAEHATAWRSADLGPENAKVPCRFRRGFVEQLRITAKTLLSGAERLMRNAPIRELVLFEASHLAKELADCPLLSRVEQLELSHGSAIGDTGMEQFLTSPYLGRIKDLRLHSSNIGFAGTRALVNSQVIGRLRRLSLGNSIGANEIEILCQAKSLGELRFLDFQHSRLGNLGVEHLANSGAFGAVEKLALHGVGMSAAALRTLVNSSHFPGVRSLDISENPVGNEGVEALGASQNFAQLEELQAKGCAIGLSGVRALVSSSRFPRLGGIDLSANHITAEVLAEAKRSWRLPPPKVLCLGWNNIGDAGAQTLAGSPFLVALEVLELPDARLSAWGVKALATSANLAKLRKLNLAANTFDDNALRALAAFPQLEGLRVLNLAGNRISDDGTRALCESKFLHNLVELNLEATEISDHGMRHLLCARLGQGLRSLAIQGFCISWPNVNAITEARNLSHLGWTRSADHREDGRIDKTLDQTFLTPQSLVDQYGSE
jgi:uncharacterized protein (TIGR02996 family)